MVFTGVRDAVKGKNCFDRLQTRCSISIRKEVTLMAKKRKAAKASKKKKASKKTAKKK